MFYTFLNKNKKIVHLFRSSNVGKCAKLFDDYKKIKKDYEEEKITKKGKNIVSLTESGEI